MFLPLKNTFLSAKITSALKAFSFLATELIIQIGQHREYMKLTLRTLAFRQNEHKNCDLCAISIQKYGATPRLVMKSLM